MTYLVDTNVISEGMRRSPDPDVAGWLDTVDESITYLSVITLGEIRRGIEKLPFSRRRDHLEAWLSDGLVQRFSGSRLLSVDDQVADEWGRTLARCEAAGRPVDPVDCQIAATALCHDLTVVTRNVKDFEPTGVDVVNPWTG